MVKDGFPVEVVQNPTDYPLIGRGGNGAVFKLSDEHCVKIYPNKAFARAESAALRVGQDSPAFPRLVKSGRKYVVMELINGTLLDEYLRDKGVLDEQITEQILFVLKELKRLRFSRRDARLRHLVLTEEGSLKVIDHVNSQTKHYKYPEKLLKGLDELGMKPAFLKQVKQRDPELYRKWKSK
ncbi:hypothetical protein SD71_04570 [Cohnella kolymensis]|uniref:Kinase n=1 Tax=Cohnella kolymensis TaxID=1590652 RepID=A0ABR5A7M7_9BACL|nr:hypothetical protein SD71_04570 [Cohnella kolymensis]